MASLIKVDVYKDSDLPLVNRILNVMDKLKHQFCFYGSKNRLLLSEYAYLITVDGRDAGFIYLLNESNKTNDILFLDIAILKEFRSRNVAYTYLKEVLLDESIPSDKFIVAEVESCNKASIRLMNKLDAIKVADEYYLLQRKKYNEFKSFVKFNDITLDDIHDDFKKSIEICRDKTFQKKKIMF